MSRATRSTVATIILHISINIVIDNFGRRGGGWSDGDDDEGCVSDSGLIDDIDLERDLMRSQITAMYKSRGIIKGIICVFGT